MKVLFAHQNFPAQFRHVASALAEDPANRVMALGDLHARPVSGVDLLPYALPPVDDRAAHPFARTFDLECRRTERILYLASSLKAEGFYPDVIVAHTGWGEHLPFRAVYPRARMIAYCEFFYRAEGLDVGFDPEAEGLGVDGRVALGLRNASTLLALAEADGAVTPTQWQRSIFPEIFHPRLTVLHDGIDLDVIDRVLEGKDVGLPLPNGGSAKPGDEIVTYVARDLEPLRGFRTFMRALPLILRRRPNARILVVGGNGVSYGPAPPGNATWKDLCLAELGTALDRSRVEFLGRLPFVAYLKLLAVSTVHVYLTYPFVLSWSLLEAMAAGCAVVASATPPVQEVMEDGHNGLLVGFFEPEEVADAVVSVLQEPRRFDFMRRAARATIGRRFARDACTAAWLEFLRG